MTPKVIDVHCLGGFHKETLLDKGTRLTVIWQASSWPWCTLSDLWFEDVDGHRIDTPACFQNRRPPSGGDKRISLDYTGDPIPALCHQWKVPKTGLLGQVLGWLKGNGTGVIRNH